MAKAETPNDLASFTIEWIKRNQWMVAALTGGTGSGKSTLAGRIGQSISRMNGVPFSFDKNYTYTRTELTEWIEPGPKQKPKGSVIIIDEAITLLFNRNWNNTHQKKLIDLLNKSRTINCTVLALIPRFVRIDKAIREDIFHLWIHIYKVHKEAFALERDDTNPFIEDLFKMKEAAKRYKGEPRGLDNCVGTLGWEQFTPEEEAVYIEVRERKRMMKEAEEDEMSNTRRYNEVRQQRNALIRKILQVTNLSGVQVGELCGLTPVQVSRIANGA